ncbi:MAG: hypothetical protein ACPGWR_15505 [Ardenticatenaceae bacterium]
MRRLLSAIKTDVTVQVRNNLYAIGIGVGALVAVVLSQLASPEQLSLAVPTLMLLVVGGTTLLYVAGMILFEKDEGTLNAVIVSPLRPAEYLWSKIITLTALATLESAVMIGGAMLIMSWSAEPAELTLPNIPILLIGIIAIGIIYTLIGVILVVRYNQITDFLMPMAAIAVILQLPFLYFLGIVEQPLLLIIPTSAPTVLMQGAYIQLEAWQWLYAIAYTGLLIIGLNIWATRAFHTHIIMKVG